MDDIFEQLMTELAKVEKNYGLNCPWFNADTVYTLIEKCRSRVLQKEATLLDDLSYGE